MASSTVGWRFQSRQTVVTAPHLLYGLPCVLSVWYLMLGCDSRSSRNGIARPLVAQWYCEAGSMLSSVIDLSCPLYAIFFLLLFSRLAAPHLVLDFLTRYCRSHHLMAGVVLSGQM